MKIYVFTKMSLNIATFDLFENGNEYENFDNKLIRKSIELIKKGKLIENNIYKTRLSLDKERRLFLNFEFIENIKDHPEYSLMGDLKLIQEASEYPIVLIGLDDLIFSKSSENTKELITPIGELEVKKIAD